MLENRSYKDDAAKIGRSLRNAGGYQKQRMPYWSWRGESKTLQNGASR